MSGEKGACGKVLKGCPATEAGVHVVPPLEFIAFAELPTKQHDPAIT
jgi:hypothetical protein